jgi:CDP-glycerol glycerophosphotransferase
VEPYLRECLDSILAAPASCDLEVVAVDDASPDGCGPILAEYAARDARLRVVSLGTNVGLGAARNAGLKQAAGAYVWFVDGDDWLLPGAVHAVVQRLSAVEPDVLVVGYHRAFADGRRVVEPIVPAAPAAGPLPDVFTLRQHPAVVHGLPMVWNKVVRRSFLQDVGVRFGAGWYEDIAVTHSVLLAARRISVLDRDCYAYRQRPGSITVTRAERHFEVFAEWQRAFAFLDAHADSYGDLRPLAFQRMIWHYLGVLNHPDRIPAQRRRAFFRRTVADFHRLRPIEGYPSPGGVANLKFAMVSWGAFDLFEVLRAVYRSRHRLSGRGSGA